MGIFSKARMVYPDSDFAKAYATVFAAARRSGRNSGIMDLLIATAAVRENARLLTRNRKDFLDIPGLELILY
jgi:predicted nucleic acid-binding protein